MKNVVTILTCEHGGNQVPDCWRQQVKIPKNVLQSHRGWDPGALELFRELTKIGVAGSYYSENTRLLIELNRSLEKWDTFSEYSSGLSPEAKQDIIETLYQPYRNEVTKAIGRHYSKGKTVWHLSVHTFTPILNGEVRTAEIGLLYDPRREGEKQFARRWQHALKRQLGPEYRVRLNYPYRGTADGFVTALREDFPSDRYVGIEIEVNQGLKAKSTAWRRTKEALRATLEQLKRHL